MKNHIHCERCGKMIYENRKPWSYVNINLVRYNILCNGCVEALGGCDDGT
jgi:hypothetical protein